MLNLKEKKEQTKKLIIEKYGSIILNRKQVAEILNRSVATIDRWKERGEHLSFKKVGKSKNAMIEYNIDTIVDYIYENSIKIME